MDRQQKIKALQLISEGKTPQEAVKLAEMPLVMIFHEDEQKEIEELRQSGYDGEIFTFHVLHSGIPIANSEDEVDLTRHEGPY